MHLISSEHWDAFVMMIREVQEATGIAMDVSNVEHNLATRLRGQFPGHHQMAACTVIADAGLRKRSGVAGFPLLATSCDGPQPNRPGFVVATLALKVLDTRTKSLAATGGFHVPFAYDVFPDGRRILEAGGLRLDTRFHASLYQGGTIVEDTRSAFAAVPEWTGFVTSAIASFPSRDGDETLDDARQRALGEFFVD